MSRGFSKEIKIGNKIISDSSPAFLIGEIGSNHNQSIKTAKELIDIAKEVGLDAVKFQCLKFDELYLDTPETKDLKKLHAQADLENEKLSELFKYCQKKDIIFIASATYIESVFFLEKLGVAVHKVASPITVGFTELVAKIADTNKPVIMSCGYCNEKEIDRSVLKFHKNKNLILLHCISSYPTEAKDLALGYMNRLKKRYGCIVGFSDHSMSTSLPAVAVALGAKVIEKHYTLSRKMHGPDHAFAIEPNELKEMVQNIRDAEASMTDKRKLQPFEKSFKKVVKMKIVSAYDLEKGKILKLSDLKFRRANSGIDESRINKLIGMKIKKNIKKMTIVKISDLQ